MFLNSHSKRLCRAAVSKYNSARTLSVNMGYRAACVNISVNNVDIWNQRLSHIHKEYYRKIGVKEYVSSSVGEEQRFCWKCQQEPGKSLFCAHCQSLQKPRIANYFQVLGLEETFTLDEARLSKTYKDLQKLLHPDKFSNKDKTEQEISAQYSSLVNKAYSTLLQPLSRGIYMLKMNGVEISEQTQMESTFLHEIMERNEEVEEAETEEQVMKLYKEIKQVLEKLICELGGTLEHGDLTKAKDVIVRMKYYTSIETQLKETIRRMGIVE